MFSAIRNYFFKGPTTPVPPSTEQAAKTPLQKSAESDASKAFQAKQLREGEGSSGIIDRVYQNVRKYFYESFKGKDPAQPEKIQEAMKCMGGESLDLEVGNDLKMRGMFFSVQALYKTLRAAGAQKASFVNAAAHATIPAFVLDPQHPNYESVMHSMAQMGFLACTRKDPAAETSFVEGIWQKREVDGKVYLFSKENADKLAKDWKAFPGGKLDQNRVTIQDVQELPTTPSSTPVVVLNGGLYSRFESFRTASEVAKFLSLGVDVIVSEDKHARVLDTESHGCVMANRRAIHDELRKRGYSNEQIIWKGTCFSAIPAAEAAAAFEGSHVIIDQGYMSAKEIVAKQITPIYLRILCPLVRPVVGKLAESVDFKYEMQEHLSKIKGKVCLISNKHDEVVDKNDVIQMRALLGNKQDVSQFEITERIEHAGPWFKDKAVSIGMDGFMNDVKGTSASAPEQDVSQFEIAEKMEHAGPWFKDKTVNFSRDRFMNDVMGTSARLL